MAYLNKVMLIGNLGNDPEIRASTTTGKRNVRFSLAVSKRYKDNNGEQKEQTTWLNIVGWGKLVDVIEQFGLKKGMQIYVEGELNTRSYADNDGKTRYVTEVNMGNFQNLTPKSAATNAQPGHGNFHSANNPYSQNNASQQAIAPEYNGQDDDLPW